jgi:hypothetical protein
LGRYWKTLVLASTLSVAAASTIPLSAEAASSPVVSAEAAPSYVPHPELSVSFGWVTATIYFNRYETNKLANLGYTAAVLCAAVGAISGGTAALACVLGFPRLVSGAQGARAAGVCVGLRFYIVSPTINWTVRHSGSRC